MINQSWQARKAELLSLMMSRLLTDQEMAEVISEGKDFNIFYNTSYNDAEKFEELLNLYIQQAKFRALENGSICPSCNKVKG